jgi:peptidoglycan/LPS O-acetylase OafA/YrhL
VYANWQVGHTWSLGYEEQFYILFPITFLFISPRRRRIFLGLFLMLPLLIVLCYLRRESFIGEYLTRFQFLLTGVVTALYSEEIKPYLSRLSPFVVYSLWRSSPSIVFLIVFPLQCSGFLSKVL